MGKIINTSEVDYSSLDREQQGWVYNCLDCCMTDEVHTKLQEKRTPYVDASYNFVRAMQAPAMHMQFRGTLIDVNLKAEIIKRLEARERLFERRVQRIVGAFWRADFNPRSPEQVKELLYNILMTPAEYKWDSATKSRKLSVDKECLEKILKSGAFYPEPIIRHILAIRDLRKKIGTLKTAIDADKRMRTGYNVSGTETGRWSSNESCFMSGTNLQNITDELREVFITDTGWKFAYIDGEQAESRVVAYESGDENYIAACEGGDLHTAVARMLWPDLKWSDEDPKHNKEVAGEKFYEHFSYRDLAKRLGHGTNYYGSPYQMAKHVHVKQEVVEDFQEMYLGRAFPGIAAWHQATATRLQTQGYLDTPMGRRRYFFGRLDDPNTLKEAIAYVPQSTIGEWLNLGLYKLWEEMDLGTQELQCMMQVHDAVLIQYPDISPEHQRKVLKKACQLMEFPIKMRHGSCLIPVDVEGVGWNWRKYKAGYNDNPDSLMGLEQDEQLQRKRQRTPEEATDLLARLL